MTNLSNWLDLWSNFPPAVCLTEKSATSLEAAQLPYTPTQAAVTASLPRLPFSVSEPQSDRHSSAYVSVILHEDGQINQYFLSALLPEFNDLSQFLSNSSKHCGSNVFSFLETVELIGLVAHLRTKLWSITLATFYYTFPQLRAHII